MYWEVVVRIPLAILPWDPLCFKGLITNTPGTWARHGPTLSALGHKSDIDQWAANAQKPSFKTA